MNAIGMHAMMNCTFDTTCLRRPCRRVSLRARLLALAVAFGGGLLAASGEQWLLEEAPPAVNELTLATCVLDGVYGDVEPAAACTLTSKADEAHEREHTL